MPTGYTAEVQNGKVDDLKTFALTCARAFGACVTMRDDPHDADIPEVFEPSDYHSDARDEAKAKLEDLTTMTPGQREAANEQDYQERLANWASRQNVGESERERYNSMLDKVMSWTPPTDDHKQLKTFMLDQLEKSIEFDCGFLFRQKKEPERRPTDEWFQEQVSRVTDLIKHHSVEHMREVERCAQRTRWVKELRESLT